MNPDAASLRLTYPDQAGRRLVQEFTIILGLCSVTLLVVSPFVAFALATFLLINLSTYTLRSVRLTLAVVAAIALAMLAGARPISPDEANDIYGYYDTYQELATGDLSYLTHFGGGLEVGLPLLFLAWGRLLPHLTINGLMFCLALTGSLLMVVWLEKTFHAERFLKHSALMGISLLMLNLYFATQLSRQFISLAILLYAFSAQGRFKQISYVILASAFHITAIPFCGMYLLAKRGARGCFLLIALALGFRLFFAQFLTAFDIVPQAVAEKMVFYIDSLDQNNEADLGSLRTIALLGLISLLSATASKFRLDPKAKPWLAMPWVTGLIQIILIPIPLASLRLTLMIHSIIPGLVAFKILEGRSQRMVLIILNFLFAYKLITITAASDTGGLFYTLSIISNFFS